VILPSAFAASSADVFARLLLSSSASPSAIDLRGNSREVEAASLCLLLRDDPGRLRALLDGARPGVVEGGREIVLARIRAFGVVDGGL
jgi:hypothetical protein